MQVGAQETTCSWCLFQLSSKEICSWSTAHHSLPLSGHRNSGTYFLKLSHPRRSLCTLKTGKYLFGGVKSFFVPFSLSLFEDYMICASNFINFSYFLLMVCFYSVSLDNVLLGGFWLFSCFVGLGLCEKGPLELLLHNRNRSFSQQFSIHFLDIRKPSKKLNA